MLNDEELRFLDEDGYAYSSGSSIEIPEGATEVDTFYDLRPPQAGFKFDLASEAWVDCRSDEEKASEVRETRNELLRQTDWTQVADVPVTIKQPYTDYRQALRDITEQSGFPDNVTWPDAP